MKIQLSTDILWNFFLFILTRSAFLRLLFWGKNGKFQEGVFVFIVAILPSAAQGLRTIKGEVLDIFPWNLHTLCNLLFPMSWQRVSSKKINFGSGLHLRIAENLDSGISNPKLWTQLWFFETSHCHGIEYSLTVCEIWVENDNNCFFYKS